MNKKGYFLVEAIVSITVVAIVITILFANMTKSYVNESNETTKYNTTEGLYTAKEVRKVLKEQVETFKTSLGTKAYIDVTNKMSSEIAALDIKYIYFTTYDTENLLKSNAKIPILVKQSLSKPSEQTDNCSYRYIIIFNDNSYSSIGAECNTDDYSLTVVPSGGTWNGSQQAQKFVQLGGTTKKIDALSNTGTYEISYNRNGQGASFAASPLSVPRPFKKWQKIGGGTFEKSTNTYTFGGKNGILTATYGYATFNLPIITKTGYTCYWRKGSPSGEQYTSGAEVSINSNTSFYAYCEINKYTLNVNPNGGTWNGSTTSQIFVQNYLTKKTIEGTPTREGYTFNGWSKSGYGSWNSTTKEYLFRAGDGTLTANWVPNKYQMTIKLNGGEWKVYDSGRTTSDFTKDFYYKYATKFSYSRTESGDSWYINGSVGSGPLRDGYEFTGWKITSGGGSIGKELDTENDVYYFYDGNYIGNVTITAQWKPEHKLTINSGTQYMHNGGPRYLTTYETTFKYGVGTWVTFVDNNRWVTGGTPSAPPYNTNSLNCTQFTGWTVSNGRIEVRDRTFTDGTYPVYYYDGSYDGDVTITANYENICHGFTIDGNGGLFARGSTNLDSSKFSSAYSEGENLKISYNTSSIVSLDNVASAPVRSGWTFTGWATTCGGIELNDSIYYLDTTDCKDYITITAQWSQNAVTPTAPTVNKQHRMAKSCTVNTTCKTYNACVYGNSCGSYSSGSWNLGRLGSWSSSLYNGAYCYSGCESQTTADGSFTVLCSKRASRNLVTSSSCSCKTWNTKTVTNSQTCNGWKSWESGACPDGAKKLVCEEKKTN